MRCISPATAYRRDDGSVTFVAKGKEIAGEFELPCGQCIACKVHKRREWGARILMEAKAHQKKSFVTLTYDDEHLPPDLSLDHSHIQLFLKRLRRSSSNPIRYFVCGEYGEQTLRPHYHAILFGADFSDDRKLWSERKGKPVWKSNHLEKLWGKGLTEIGQVERQSAEYVAGYVVKKLSGEAAESAYTRINSITGETWQVLPEYGRMSLKPGIGLQYAMRFASDMLTHGGIIGPGGQRTPLPRYFAKHLKEKHGDRYEEMEYQLTMKARARPENHTPERREAHGKILKARNALKKREL